MDDKTAEQKTGKPGQHPERVDITAAIIAGGRGSRVNGEDKGLLLFHGLPLVSRIISRISPQVGKIIVNANRNLEIYEQFGVLVFPDNADDYQGPLAGILAALENVQTRYLLVIPCDTPAIPPDLVSRMADSLQGNQHNIAVVDDGQRMQQMFLLFESSLKTDLQSFFNAGGRAVKEWLAGHELVRVDFSDCPWAFANINSIDDLQRLESGPR